MKQITALILLIALLVSCAPAAVEIPATPVQVIVSPTPTLPPAPRVWWRGAVFYEIFIRSFNDSNGDGIGDFNGITQKLDYLQSLGVTAIWLTPIHPSPSYHGYDVLNFYAVNSQYGSMQDFKDLLQAAHERDMRIIIDLVLNHTSSQHPWFIDANSNPNSKYRDWFVWSDTSQGNKWYQGNGGFYYAYFWSGMPDLNYLNPDVTAQMEKMSVYWLNDIGVDGFRIDAAKHLIEEGKKLENTTPTHEWLKGFTTLYKAEAPDAYVVGEVAGAGGTIAEMYAGQMDQVFNFELASAIVQSSTAGAASSVSSSFKFSAKDKPDGNYATFLTNHDQNRVMSILGGDVNKAKLAASLMLTAHGTPFIYYGEEIGMQGKKPDEDIRLPMQWNDNLATAGFTPGIPWRAPHPATEFANVAAEDADPDSLLNHYRALIALRKKHSALQTGTLTVLETRNPAVFASLRQEGEQAILILINLGSEKVTDYTLGLSAGSLPNTTYKLETIFGEAAARDLPVRNGKFNGYQPLAELAAQSTYIFNLK